MTIGDTKLIQRISEVTRDGFDEQLELEIEDRTLDRTSADQVLVHDLGRRAAQLQRGG
ncbi:MAG: hypothetical protein ABIS28_08310 [Caldimonas sp.]